MGLLDWMERTTARLNGMADDAGIPTTRREPARSITPDDPERGTTRALLEEDVNGFLAASEQTPDRRRMDADEFMRVMRHGPESRRLARLERDMSWLRSEARLARVPESELGDLL